MSGPLAGYKIIEIAGIGPGPFAAMLLSDMGAEVIRVERAAAVRGPAPDRAHPDILRRGRRNIALDLKHPDGVAALLELVGRADALIEGFRPGVMERLGVGPDECLEMNPRLVYGRVTGWGREGPLAMAAGHDLYLQKEGTEAFQLDIFDVLGQLVHSTTWTGNSKILDIQGWNAGIYLILMTDEHGAAASFKWLKQ